MTQKVGKNLLAADAQGVVPPVVDKGDLYTHDGTTVARRTIGTEGQVLTVRATENSGLRWENPSTPTLPIGGVLWSASETTPTGYLPADGAAVSRTTYANLLAAIRSQRTVTTNSGSPLLTGLVTTARLYPGEPVEGSGIPAGSYILSVDSSTQVTLNQNCTASATVTATFFPYGAGDGAGTFNVPNLSGRVPVAVGSGTQSLTIVSVDTATDIITTTPNQTLQTGQPVVYTSSGSAIGGLTSGNTYYVIRQSGNDRTVALASTLANAVAGVAINLTSAGSGTQTLGASLTVRRPGELRGEESHALVVGEIPAHTHSTAFTAGGSDGSSGSGNQRGASGSTGGSGAHNTLSPELGLFAYIYAG
jgi:microcystin-dependent protein